jgi:predicted ester cyclase
VVVNQPSSVDVARSVVDAVDRHDLPELRRWWSPSIVETVPFVGRLEGTEALADYFTEMFAALPDFGLEAERVAGSGETVFVQWRMTGTFSGGAWNGIEATGRAIDLRGMDCMTIRGSEIVENFVTYDTVAFMKQAGISP